MEWPGQLGAGDLLRVGRVNRSDCEVGDDEESEDHKGADSHGPPKSDLLDEAVTMMGKMTPPILEPVERMPKAAPLLLSNHP